MLVGHINDQKKEIQKVKAFKTRSANAFEYATYGEWKNKDDKLKAMNDNEIATFLCQQCDYIVNPSIKFKFMPILNSLLDKLHLLQGNPQCFESLLRKISDLQ